jgi:hypothetical protein
MDLVSVIVEIAKRLKDTPRPHLALAVLALFCVIVVAWAYDLFEPKRPEVFKQS